MNTFTKTLSPINKNKLHGASSAAHAAFKEKLNFMPVPYQILNSIHLLLLLIKGILKTYKPHENSLPPPA